MVTGHNLGILMLFLALAVLVLPLQWIAAAVLAGAFHELCHYVALRLCRGQVHGLSVGLFGARMRAGGLSTMQQLLCALAGPAGSFLLLVCARWMPRIAICAGFQGVYNLLPVYPLDGGRALRCFTELCLPERISRAICNWTEWLCLIGTVFLGLYGCFALHLGVFPLLGAISLMSRTFQGKIPCKPWGNSVQ